MIDVRVSFGRNEDIFCDYDEAFTRREIYEETNWCENCCHIGCIYNQNKKMIKVEIVS